MVVLSVEIWDISRKIVLSGITRMGEMGMLKDGCMLWVMQRGMEMLRETRTQMSSHEKWVCVLDIQVTLHDKRIVMQVTLHYEAIVMQVTLHDKRVVMKVTLHYEAIVMQVMLHDKRIVMQVTLHYEAIVMQVTLHYEFKQTFPREKVVYQTIDELYIVLP
nr:hypothetical protein [Tanacetum cinerariifolium]